MKFSFSKSLNTKRLLLRPVALSYAQVIFKEFTNEVTLFMYPVTPNKVSDTKQFIVETKQNFKQGKEVVCVILKKTNKEFLGCVGLHKINTKMPELGIWIKQSAHGHHYGREAVTAMKLWADVNIDYKYIKYPVVKQNIPSRKIPESLGGVVGKRYTKKMLSGKVYQMVDYYIHKQKPRIAAG